MMPAAAVSFFGALVKAIGVVYQLLNCHYKQREGTSRCLPWLSLALPDVASWPDSQAEPRSFDRLFIIITSLPVYSDTICAIF